MLTSISSHPLYIIGDDGAFVVMTAASRRQWSLRDMLRVLVNRSNSIASGNNEIYVVRLVSLLNKDLS